MEIWTTGAASPRGIMKLAREVEDKGWDGLAVVDSQNLSGDPYVSLAMAATVTERIGLATAVTNSVTRQAAATATAIAGGDLRQEVQPRSERDVLGNAFQQIAPVTEQLFVSNGALRQVPGFGNSD